MSGAAGRYIATLGSPVVPFDFLQSLFVAEVVHPSRRLWIVSPWVSDVELIENRARQFGPLCPDWPAARIRLSTVLGTLLERGGELVVVVNLDPHNNELIGRLRDLEPASEKAVRIIQSENLHEKGILGDNFLLTGSMNMTYHGVYVNEESLEFTLDRGRIEERRVVLEHRWRERL